MEQNAVETLGVDSKLQAVIDLIKQREQKAAVKQKFSEGPVFDKDNPPRSYEEFLQMEGLDEWPDRLTSEGPLALDESDYIFKSPEDVVKLLTQAASLDLSLLDNLEDKLMQIESVLIRYADKMVTNEIIRESKIKKNLFYVPKKVLELAEKAEISPRKTVEESETLVEMRKKDRQFCSYPGFRKSELTELPSQLEAPQILNRVTKAQDFNSGFKKFWKKIFQSEASVAIMQDAFWWFFIDNYEKQRLQERNPLFDRIADSFVALITSIDPEVKDKFFQSYSDCLSQSIYATFYEAFPESLRYFNDDFKTTIVNTISQWVSGIKPSPESWRNWNIKRLLKKPQQVVDNGIKQGAHNITTQSIETMTSIDLDIDGFERMVNRLGDQTRPLSRSGTGGVTGSPPSIVISREQTKIATATPMIKGTTPRRMEQESHQIGPGPSLQRVMFNTFGRSPLVAHYLQMRELQAPGLIVTKMKRTEIAKLPPEGPTYKDLISNRMAMSEALSIQYNKICEQTNQELSQIEKRKRDINRKINKLQKELLFNKDPLELKSMSEKILEMRERNVPMSFQGGTGAGSDDEYSLSDKATTNENKQS